MTFLYDSLFKTSEKKRLAVLIDPDKENEQGLLRKIKLSEENGVDFFLVGGSLLFSGIDPVIEMIKQHTKLPVLLFPGNNWQLSDKADGILLLSLISGRNPELLIGKHVEAAPMLKQSSLEIIPTAYILIDGKSSTSVSYMSATSPIPSSKNDIAVATAMAGEMLGLRQIYLEAGSGAAEYVPPEMIRRVKQQIDIPLIVGGGIRTADALRLVYEAGADIVVVGTAFEQNPDLLRSFSKVKFSF